MANLSCQEVVPLLCAAAMDALDGIEARAVSEHLLRCRECRHELDRYVDTVDYVGFGAPQITPRPTLRRAILAALAADDRKPGTARWQWAAMVAAALIVMLLAGNIALQLHLIGAGNRSTAQPSRITSAPAAPPLVWFDLASVAPDSSSAQGTLCAQQAGNLAWLIVQNLPQLSVDKTYQVWLTSGDQRVSVGTFGVDSLGRGFLTIHLAHPIGTYTFLGVTDEPQGGSIAPTGERLLGVSL